MKKALLFSLLVWLQAKTIVCAQVKENRTDYQVVAVDHFGRSFGTIGGYKPQKQVGIFYWPWIGQPYASGIYDATKISAKPDGLRLLYDFKYLNDTISPNGQAHFWGEPLWGYYNSADEWVIRRQMKMLTTAGIDFIAFDLTNRVTYRSVYEKVLRIIEEMQQQGANPPKVVFYTHSKSFETTWQLYRDLYQPGLYSNAWYKVKGKPMIIAYTKMEDDIAEAASRGDTTYRPVAYTQAVKDFFYFKKPQWPFDPVYPDGFPWVEWSFPPPLHGNIMSVSVASHPKVPMSRSLTSGWINWGRGWDPDTKQNKMEDVDRGAFFQRQWDHAFKVDPDTVFVGGWNEWIAYKQPYGDEYMLCDAADREYSRDIEPMRGGYEDAFYIQLIKNVRKYKGIPDNQPAFSPAIIDISKDAAQWAPVKARYKNLNTVENGRNDYGASQKVHYTQAAPANLLQEVRVAHDAESFYFLIQAAQPFVQQAVVVHRTQILLGKNELSLKGWNGYEYLLEADQQAGKAILYKLSSGYKKEKQGEAKLYVNGNHLQLKVARKDLQATKGTHQLYFKVADGVSKPEDIMEYYVSGSVLPMGRLSYRYHFTDHTN